MEKEFKNEIKGLDSISLRDYFASQAMNVVMQETQEMRIASFWDWIKYLLISHLSLTFLEVKYVQIENVYIEAAQRAYQYADAMMEARYENQE